MEDQALPHYKRTIRPQTFLSCSLPHTLSSSLIVFCSSLIVGAMAAEWFVGPIMEKVINSCSEYLEDQFRWQRGMKEELERLRENHPKIQAVVFAATQAQIGDRNPALNKWLWQLRDAIDEADDLLDEFEYRKHEEHLAENIDQETKVRSAPTSFLFETARKLRKVGERALKIDPNLKRLAEVVQKLDRISAEVGTFLHLLESTKQEQQEQQLDLYKTRETGSLPKNDLIGRVEDKKFVMQWLKQPSNEEHQTHITATTLYNNVSLLSIVGHGGMGKTTLLQHVYEDEITKDFDLKMWVCVSNDFCVKKVIVNMLESLKKKKPNLESLDALQGCLKCEVMSKKFLLVLDDIWEVEEELDKSKWENVLSPLAYGSLGSKILITTRMDSVASMIAKVTRKKKETLRLMGLKNDECLQLLNTHAFADVENIDDHKKLRSIAGEIVKRISGSPLAAKVIGGVLNSNLDEKHWIRVLDSDFRNAELGQNNILHILKLSYIFLPKPLQNCLAYCCIFPQDYEFNKTDLVRMWISVGFIQSHSNSRETMEDIGGRYFDILVKRSFFDKFSDFIYTYYKMHDLLHQLAQSVSAQECLRVVDDKQIFFRIPETIRHLSVTTSNLEVLKEMIELKNLRSLYLIYKKCDQGFIDVLAKIFEVSRSIRLLYIDAPNLTMIPESIGYLIHLRYLNIRVGVTLLPCSLSNLFQLQFLICNSTSMSSSDNFFLRGIKNLSNLRHLQLPWNYLPEMHDIGKLTALQNLDGYCVRNENGCRIGELEHMNDLCFLRIMLLDNVEDATEACNAKLCNKRNLTNLILNWGLHSGFRKNIVDPNLDERVLDNLQPHNNLRELKIIEYMGVRPAIWMNNEHLINNLEYIELHSCLKWQTLPPFGQLPFLKSLCLDNMSKVQRLDNKFHGNYKCCVFPSLKVLRIERLEALENWFDIGVAAEDDCLFPRLIEMHFVNCPNLQELPYLPPKLETLSLHNIGWRNLNCCSISKSSPLKRLDVIHCPNMTCIHLADEITRLTALRDLTIRDCPNLITLGGHQVVETTEKCHLILDELTINDPSVFLMEPLRSITFIQILNIMCNDKLVSFSVEAEQWLLQVRSSVCKLYISNLKSLQSLPFSLESFSSLKTLYFSNLKSLQSLPFSLESFSSLESLSVWDVPQVQLLPNIPASLENLYLQGLKSLQCLPSSLSTISSLKYLRLAYIPLLKSLPELPPSLCELVLVGLDNLDCLPSCLPSLSSLTKITIYDVPLLRELPDLPLSLKRLSIQHCHSELMERYKKFSDSDS